MKFISNFIFGIMNKKEKLDRQVLNTGQKILYPILLTLIFSGIYIYIFDSKINIGGDNAVYYILGKSIAEGASYSNIHLPEETAHTHFPPGYPAILAFFISLFSSNIIFLKLVNGIFLLGTIILMFYILKKIFNDQRIAFAGSLLMLFNYHLLHYSTIIMSEIPYLFFSTLTIFLFIRSLGHRNPQYHLGLYFVIILSAFIYHIRSIGIAFTGGLLFYLLLHKKFTYFISYLFGFIILCLPWFFRNRVLESTGYIKSLLMKNPYRSEEGFATINDLMERIFINLKRYVGIEIPHALLPYNIRNEYSNFLGSGNLTGNQIIIGIILIVFLLYGIIKLPKYRDLFIWYIMATFVILLLWPQVWYGIRFMLPLTPFLLFLLFYGIFKFIDFLMKKLKLIKYLNPLLITFAVLFFTVNIKALNIKAKSNNSPEYNDYYEAGNYINKNMPTDVVICCRKPGLLYLYAHRKVARFASTYDFNNLLDKLVKDQVTHVVLDDLGYGDEYRYLIPVVLANQEKFKVLKKYNTSRTYVLEFNPKLGYQGYWKRLSPDQKTGVGKSVKEGTGSFYYPDGSIFEGTWINDKKEGLGRVTYPNGEVIEGIWENDKMIDANSKKF